MPSDDIFSESTGEAAPEIRNLTREQAIEYGRKLAEAIDPHDEGRMRRAMAYAAWDYDGRPISSAPQREEMGVESPDLAGYEERRAMWAKRGEQP